MIKLIFLLLFRANWCHNISPTIFILWVLLLSTKWSQKGGCLLPALQIPIILLSALLILDGTRNILFPDGYCFFLDISIVFCTTGNYFGCEDPTFSLHLLPSEPKW